MARTRETPARNSQRSARAIAVGSSDADATPGTERFRDAQRTGGGPRMHGRGWHEPPEQKHFEPAVMAGEGAAPDVVHGGTGSGMGKLHGDAQTTQGKVRRKRTTPVGKGPKRKPGAAKKKRKSGHRYNGGHA